MLTRVVPTVNYYVQQMFGANAGDTYLPVAAGDGREAAGLAFSAERD